MPNPPSTVIRRPFDKQPKLYQEQVLILKARGMLISDVADAEFKLQHLNYYRLSAYWLPFEADHSTHAFRPGTSFDDVVNLYDFDRELRLLFLDAIERIEVSVRSHWAYHMAHNHTSHGHLEVSIHDNRPDREGRRKWNDNFNDLRIEVDRSKETFIVHMRDTYSDPLPPVWAVCEVMSMGLLSRWYSSLKPMVTRRAISDCYQLNEEVFESWLHHLSIMRNICAHHSRLWNRSLPLAPMIPRTRPVNLPAEFLPRSNKLYNTMIILIHFMDTVVPGHTWRADMKSLILKHNIVVQDMGFPSNWLSRPIWH